MPWYRSPQALLLSMVVLAACGGGGGGDAPTEPGGVLGNFSGRLNPPGFISGEPLSTGGARIDWFDSNNIEDGYIVQRRLPDTEAWATVGFFPPDSTSATDREAADRATYFYRVVAFRATETAASPEIRITIKDRTPPQTELLFHPPELTRSKEATFLFRSSEGASTFICEVDGALRPCNSVLGCLEDDPNCRGELDLAGLADGEHNFNVRAIDAAGNEDPTPTGWVWTVDTTPPNITIEQQPDTVVGGPTGNSVTIAWSLDDPEASVTCFSDGVPTPCSSPHVENFPSFPHGSHSFLIQATDPLGNVSSRNITFNLDFRAPEVSFGANVPTPFTQPTDRYVVEMNIADIDADLAAAAPIQCRWVWQTAPGVWEDTGYVGCSFDRNISTPPNCTGGSASGEGTHFAEYCNPPTAEGPVTFAVRLEDQFGNNNEADLADLNAPNAAAYSITWVVDGTPPALTWTTTPFDPRTPPANLGEPTTALVSYLTYDFASTNEAYTGAGAGEAIQGYYCTWGPSPLSGAACTPPLAFADVPPGTYTLEVTAVDAAGNVAAPLVHSVDVTYPALSQDPCDAGGDLVQVIDMVVQQGRNNDSASNNESVTPLTDYHYQELVQSVLLLRFLYNSASGASYIWGGGDHDYSEENEKVIHYSGSSVTPGTCGTGVLNNNLAIVASGAPAASHKWYYMVGLSAGMNTNSFTEAERANADRFGMAEISLSDRLIARHRHPARGNLVAAGSLQQMLVDIDLRTSPTAPLATTLEITARAPEGDVLATTAVALAPLGIVTAGDDADIDASIFVEPPYCAGMFALEVSAVPPRNTSSRLFDRYDEVRIPVQAGSYDKYEPNDAEIAAAGPLTVPVGEPNLHFGGGDTSDWFGVEPGAAGPITITVIDPAASGTQFWLQLNENSAPFAGPVSGTGSVTLNAGSLTLTGNYTLEISAPAAPPCLRYRLSITQ